MIKRGQSKSGEFTVMSVDVVWTAEFAANGWLTELPADKFPTTGFLKPAVDGASYFNKLYAMPSTSDGALLYYRKDLLDKAGLQPPKTWDEMQAVCDKVLPGQSGMSCYGGQFQKYEGLTCNFAEAVNSAGGAILDDAGKPTVNSAEANAGLTWMVNGFKTGMIPKEAITWKEEESRTAFQNSKILFLRNWPYVWNLSNGSKSKIAGKIRRRADPRQDRSGRLDPRWPQLRHLDLRQEQGHRDEVDQLDAHRREPEEVAADGLQRPGARVAVRRSGTDQAVPLPAHARRIDQERQAAPEGRPLR